MRTRPNRALLRNTISSGSNVTITNPTAYWKLNEGTGNFSITTDQVTSPSQNILTMVGTVTGPTGKIGLAANAASGSNALQNTSAPAKMTTSGTFSGCGWFNLDILSGGIFMKIGNTTSSGWDLSVAGIFISLTTYQTGPTSTSKFIFPSFSTGQWHFLAWYYDSSTLGISFDGGSFSTGSGNAPGSASATYLLNNNGYTSALQGSADEVSYWVGYKLTSAEVTALYNSGNGKTFNGSVWS